MRAQLQVIERAVYARCKSENAVNSRRNTHLADDGSKMYRKYCSLYFESADPYVKSDVDEFWTGEIKYLNSLTVLIVNSV